MPTFFFFFTKFCTRNICCFFNLGGLALTFKRTVLPLLSHSPNSINEYGLVAVGTLEPNSLWNSEDNSSKKLNAALLENVFSVKVK